MVLRDLRVDMRPAQRYRESRAGWARALSIFEDLARAKGRPEAQVEVGRVAKIGEGLSRDAFVAEVKPVPDPESVAGPYVVLLPRRDAGPGIDERSRRELHLLGWLQTQSLVFRVPRPLGVLPDVHGLALARAFVQGIPLDLRAGRQPSVTPWEVIGEIAASLHGLEISSVPFSVPGFLTRREHALSALRALDGLEAPEVQEARVWALQHLPPADPASLLHGDLLGQNILLDPGETRPCAVIDWEYAATGDPASDLAIVTRGKRQPFQVAGGLGRLLDAYSAAGGKAVTRQHVRIHELAMAAVWYRDAIQSPRGEGYPPDEELGLIRRILRMAEGS